jgi:hypothetical protein
MRFRNTLNLTPMVLLNYKLHLKYFYFIIDMIQDIDRLYSYNLVNWLYLLANI